MSLTSFAVENAKPRDKPYKLSDGGGLHLLVTAGSKLWRFRYQLAGKEKMLALSGRKARPNRPSRRTWLLQDLASPPARR